MVIISTVSELRQFMAQQRQDGKRIGLVPTMGALHDGHLSLVAASSEQCGATIVSIFVNPLQFGPSEDFNRYPRTLENDLTLLETAGVPAVFVPSAEEMYPNGFDAVVRIGGVTTPFEGAVRPGHFDGVATVVLKLFLAAGADAAFFGQKDYQQVCVIRKMVNDLNVPIDVVMCPIIREEDGLAMSSRNRYLSDAERRQAAVLSQSLADAQLMFTHYHVRSSAVITQTIRDKLQAAGLSPDYIAVADPVTLQEIEEIDSAAVILLAVRLGTTRLIDNVLFD